MAGSDIPLAPTSKGDARLEWKWDTLFDTVVDIDLRLDRKSYIGAVDIKLNESSVKRAEILVDGKVSGEKHAESGKLIGGALVIPIGVYGSEVTIRFHADFQDVILDLPEIVGAYDDGAPVIIPSPKSAEFCDTVYKIKSITAENNDNDEEYASAFLADRIRELYQSSPIGEGIEIVFKKDESYENERYTAALNDGRITVTASTRLALLYGADTVLKCISADGVRGMNIDDKPSKRLRGFHFGLPHRDRLDFAKRLFKYVLLPMRYNVIFLEFAGGMRFDRRPEISEAWLKAAENSKKGLQPPLPHSDKVSRFSLLEKDDIRDLVAYARELGLEVVPEVQSLGHVQYLTYAYPEIAELEESKKKIDTRAEDARPDEFYAHCYCPSNEKSYEIIFDVIDEIIEVVNPREYVHIGHDEVYQIGICPKCRDKSPAELFAYHANRLHGYLKSKGLKTMMWSDMLQPPPVTTYLTYGAIDMIPKDIVMLDFIWYFNVEHNIEDNLIEKGFKVCAGNLYSSHYTRYRSRMLKDGMIGGEVSTWIIADEEKLGEYGKFWDIMYLSEMLWNTENYDERNRRTYTEMLAKFILPQTRDGVRNSFHGMEYTEDRLQISGAQDGIPHELLLVAESTTFAENNVTRVGKAYDRLVFEQSTLFPAPRINWKEQKVLGKYIITYEDGTSVDAVMRYVRCAMIYKRAYAEPYYQQYHRHFGYPGTWFSDPAIQAKNEAGEDISVLGYVWNNPHPQKVIDSIKYVRDEGDFCHLMLSGIRGIKYEK